MEPETRFCTSTDGVRIAYSTLGEGTPIVISQAYGFNFDLAWSRIPEVRTFIESLGQGYQLTWITPRGIGASERDIEDVSLDAQLGDLTAVIQHAGLGELELFGMYEGCAICIRYAVEHPERVRRLVLWGSYAKPRDALTPDNVETWRHLIMNDWSLARRAAANISFPDGPANRQRWMSKTWKDSIKPEMMVKHIEGAGNVEVRAQLSRIVAPTLVIHSTGDRVVPIEMGKEVAAGIPDARFVAVEGTEAAPFSSEYEVAATIRRFLSDDASATPDGQPGASGALRTVLFTDIVGHTEMMSRLGDERGRNVLREHERITREVLGAHDGTEVKTMGDGFMASFGSVTKAVECAIALQRAFAEREGDEPLRVRVGINAGEPIEEDGDLFGATVILASRIAAKAEGGEILVADTVRGLSSGKGFLFADRGEFVAKGFEDAVRLYEVSWRKE